MANEWPRKSYTGAAVATTLNGAISGVATAIVLTNGSTYPDGTGGPFVICIDRGLPTEEKIICSARSGNNVTALQRGYDGSAAVAHSNAAPVEHVLDANTINQANAHAAAALGVGSMAYRSGLLTYAELVPGAIGIPIISGGALTAPAYGPVLAAGIATDAVIAAKIQANAVTTPKILDRNVTGAKLAGSKWRRNANQAVSSGGGAAVVLLDVEDYDDLNTTMVSGVVTIGTAGAYVIGGRVQYASAPPSGSYALIAPGASVGGIGTISQFDGAESARACGASAWFNVGDTFRMLTALASGPNINMSAFLFLTYLGG